MDLINTILEKEFFHKSQVKSIPKSSGIYILLNLAHEVIYVGKSVDLNKRIKTHIGGYGKKRFSDEIKEEVVFYTYIEILEPIEMDLNETLIIDKLKPKYNIDKISNNRGSRYNIHNKVKQESIKIDIKHINKDIENDTINFIIRLFKANRSFKIGIHALKQLLRNHNLNTEGLGYGKSLTELREFGVDYVNGNFVKC